MKIESTQFTDEVFDSFVTDFFDVERRILLDRLRNIVTTVNELVPSIKEGTSGQDNWSATETLAHMATSAQFFGWLVHEIATKKDVEIDILDTLRIRDIAVSEAAKQPAAELARQLKDSITLTSKFVESVAFDDLRTPFKYLSREMTAEDLVRIPLCAHLESHVEQIRRAVGR